MKENSTSQGVPANQSFLNTRNVLMEIMHEISSIKDKLKSLSQMEIQAELNEADANLCAAICSLGAGVGHTIAVDIWEGEPVLTQKTPDIIDKELSDILASGEDNISQSKAYQLFGEARVKTWIKKGMVNCSKNGQSIRSKNLYSLAELLIVEAIQSV